MSKQLLRDSVNELKNIRAELPDNIDNSIIERFDEIIKDLEKKGKSNKDLNALDILKILDFLFKYIPQIAEFIEKLINK